MRLEGREDLVDRWPTRRTKRLDSSRRRDGPRQLQGLPGDGRRGRQDLPHAPGGAGRGGGRRDVVIGYLEPHGRSETVEQAGGLEVVPRRRVPYRDTVVEEMDLPGDRPAGPGARPDRRAGAHQPARARAQEALRGRRGRARRRHRRLLDRQRPAPREPQRQRLRADRRPGAGDDARRGPERRRRGGADRPDPGGAARPAARREDLPARAASTRRSTTSSGSRTSTRCARWRCDRSPRRSSRSAWSGSRSGSARTAWPRARRPRPWASGCSLVKPDSKGSSGWCGGPGAPPSGSAPTSTCSG